ncbi:MAG: class I SAM-dependent methyltransferase [Gemmatimonadetes bacterium]|nr:class I SAM-dependent methyltransferase [Gemmatimonadota bacterium]
MAIRTAAKLAANRLLAPLNLRVETLTERQLDEARIGALAEAGHFAEPVFPLPEAFASMADAELLEAIRGYRPRFDSFEDLSLNEVGYSFDNLFFSSPDAEVLYTIVREHRPGTVVEVGSGHSTRVTRQAIIDGGLDTTLVCIDPEPRVEITALADRVYEAPVESLGASEVRGLLAAGDVLFIDSSHRIRTGNDTVFLFLVLLPSLRSGVLVHVHDVFLPYDYPLEWALDEKRAWNEQYLVQAMLMFGDEFEILWAGHYLQRRDPEFVEHFPHSKGRLAGSLWLRKRG